MSSRAAQGDSATLSRDLADFLVEFSISLHKNAIYPAGHPLLGTAVAALTHRLRTLLHERATLSIGVARQQLVIEGVATDSNHPLLRELAQKLHAHQLGALRFSAGVEVEEIGDVLSTIAVDPGRSERPLGLEPIAELQRWKHVRLYPLSFDQLELLAGDDVPLPDDATTPADGAAASPTIARTRAAQLWIGLARAALAADTLDGAAPTASTENLPSSTDPVVVAKAIDEHQRDQAYDQVVVGYLLQIADELKAKGGHEAASLRRRISQLVGTLQPETLRRLLEMGGDVVQRRRFVLDATQGLAVDAVVDLVQAAAQTSQQTISHSMIRLLSKFAVHAEHGSGTSRPEATSALREGVQHLIADWQLDDPNPEGYRAALDGMSRAAPIFSVADTTFVCEPDRMVQMSLESGAIGDALWRATDAVMTRRGVGALFDLLENAPETHTRDALYQRYATPEQLHLLLQERQIDFAVVARVAHRLGLAAAGPLLDALESGQERDMPALAELLASLGDEAGLLVAERLKQSRWLLQRRLLSVLNLMPALPTGFSALDYLQHADARVRREALRLLVRSPDAHEHAIANALLDSDDDVVRLALTTVAKEPESAAVPVVMARVRHRGFSPEMQAIAVRSIAARQDPDALAWLLGLAVERKGWLRRVRLCPRSPEMLAAISALSAHWRADADAARAVTLAAASSDPDIRAAATSAARTSE